MALSCCFFRDGGSMELLLVCAGKTQPLPPLPPAVDSLPGVINSAIMPASQPPSPTPTLQPFHIGAQVTVEALGFAAVASFEPAIPSGKRFVIEFLSAHAMLGAGQKSYITLFIDNGQSGGQYFFAPRLVGTDSTIDHFVLSDAVKLYAVQSSFGPRVNFTRFGGNAGTAVISLILSGHLEDA